METNLPQISRAEDKDIILEKLDIIIEQNGKLLKIERNKKVLEIIKWILMVLLIIVPTIFLVKFTNGLMENLLSSSTDFGFLENLIDNL